MTKIEFERLTPELVKHISTTKEYVSTFKIVTPDNKTITKIKKTKIIAYNRYGKESVVYIYKGRDFRNVDDLITAINNDKNK